MRLAPTGHRLYILCWKSIKKCFFYMPLITLIKSPMRRLFTIILQLLPVISFSQAKDTIPFRFSDLSPQTIWLPLADTVRELPVSNIYVNDERFDTSIVGLVKSSYIMLGHKAADEISKYLHASFRLEDSNKTSNSIVIYIKKLWLTNELELLPAEAVERVKYISNWRLGVVCKMECYYKQQEVFYPLFRLDTTITTPKDLLENAPALLAACLKRLNTKLVRACASFNTNGTKMNVSQVENYYSVRFNIPVLKEPTHKKGLYRTFADFKNDKPFCSEFVLRNEKFADMVYVKDSTGLEFSDRDIWGYCDGSKLYIKSADNFFVLKRRGNSFYVRGFKDIEKWVVDPFGRPLEINGYTVPGMLKSPGMFTKMVYKLSYKNYQLDMESGQIF